MHPVTIFAGFSFRRVLLYRDINDSEADCTSGSVWGRPKQHCDYRRESFEVLGDVAFSELSRKSHRSVSERYKKLHARQRVLIRYFTGLKRPIGCIPGAICLIDCKVYLLLNADMGRAKYQQMKICHFRLLYFETMYSFLLSKSSPSAGFEILYSLKQTVVLRFCIVHLYSSRIG